MADHAQYHINEKDIETVIRHLKIYDPANADRDYAIQFIEAMQAKSNQIARSDEALAEAIREYTKKKD